MKVRLVSAATIASSKDSASDYVSRCVGTNLEKIVKVLTEVNDWENLAGWLNLGRGVINGLKTHCLREGDGLAGCYHRKLVTAYCDETGRSSVEVAHDIAHILESDMASKSQADRLRSLFFGKLCSNWCSLAPRPF